MGEFVYVCLCVPANTNLKDFKNMIVVTVKHLSDKNTTKKVKDFNFLSRAPRVNLTTEKAQKESLRSALGIISRTGTD